MVVQLSTLILRILLAAIVVVHPVSVESCDFNAVVIVGGADAVMLSPSVGGKLA